MATNPENEWPTKEFQEALGEDMLLKRFRVVHGLIEAAIRGDVQAFAKVREIAFGNPKASIEIPLEDLLSADENGSQEPDQWPSAGKERAMNADFLSSARPSDPVHNPVDSPHEQNSSRSIPDAAFENVANIDESRHATGSELAETGGNADLCQGEPMVAMQDRLANNPAQFQVFPPSPQIKRQEGDGKHVVVTGAYAPVPGQPGVLVEIIRHPENPARMVFLRWEDGIPATFN
jgi:hypothetical protein